MAVLCKGHDMWKRQVVFCTTNQTQHDPVPEVYGKREIEMKIIKGSKETDFRT